MALDELRKNDMMANLLDALEKGQDIGHYGRLVFAMVARHFVDEVELAKLLMKNPDFSEQEAKALVVQVNERDYAPPRRGTVLAWQKQQDFPICPNPNDPDACNVYRDLKFPDGVYEDIQEFYEEKAEAA